MEDKLYSKLVAKLNKEIEDYRQDLKEKGVDYAIENAYELVIKNGIGECVLYDKNLSKDELKALLSRKNLLDETYQDWLKSDRNLRENLEYVVDDSVERITDNYQKNKKNKNFER